MFEMPKIIDDKETIMKEYNFSRRLFLATWALAILFSALLYVSILALPIALVCIFVSIVSHAQKNYWGLKLTIMNRRR